MEFNSFAYIIFLPVVFLLYWFVFKRLKIQNLFIVAASYLFYGLWDWRFLSLIALTTLSSYVSGLLIGKYRSRAKIVSAANIILNIGILAVFKYFDFFSESLRLLFAGFGMEIDSVTLNLVLPVGISFYTFQALSYSIDVYRRNVEPTRDVVAFFAYISFFPQLVAGPIERSTNLLPQFSKPRVFDYDKAVDGCRQILWGFFKKLVIADNCALFVDVAFSADNSSSGSSLLIAAILFSFQIYGDFSGYSDIAIGTAKLFGIQLSRNFNSPYLSSNIAGFWRRWHISLMSWFRDYLYIPMGGNRKGKFRKWLNTFVVFALSGMWHGANLTYILWGVYHAVLYIPTVVLGKKAEAKSVFGKVAGTVMTFALVTFGFIIFRSPDVTFAADYVSAMFADIFSAPTALGLVEHLDAFVACVCGIMVMMVFEFANRRKSHAFEIGEMKPAYRRMIYIVLLLAIIRFTGQVQTFIYFQF